MYEQIKVPQVHPTTGKPTFPSRTIADHGGEDTPEERQLLDWCRKHFGDSPIDASPANADAVMVRHVRNTRMANGCERLVDFARRLMAIDVSGTIGLCRQEWEISRVVRRGTAAVVDYVRGGKL